MILEILKSVGLLMGVAAFLWKVWDAAVSYLHIDLSVNVASDGVVSAMTRVENKSSIARRIDNALLVVGPEDENPIRTYNIVLAATESDYLADSTNMIAAKKLQQVYSDERGRTLIPLPFYYSENIKIGDEKLSYRAPIESN